MPKRTAGAGSTAGRRVSVHPANAAITVTAATALAIRRVTPVRVDISRFEYRLAARRLDSRHLAKEALRSLPHRLEPFDLGLGAGSHQVDQKRRQSGKVDLERSPVRPAPV